MQRKRPVRDTQNALHRYPDAFQRWFPLRTSNLHCNRSLVTRQLLLSANGNFIELTAVSA